MRRKLMKKQADPWKIELSTHPQKTFMLKC